MPTTIPPKNEGEGNRTAARRYDAAATRHANTANTTALARMAAADLKKLSKQLDQFEVGMVVTERGGTSWARPMCVAKRSSEGMVYLVTGRDSALVEEVTRHPNVLITFQEKGQYLVLTGRGEVIEDQTLFEACWSERFRTWFPAGITESRGLVLCVTPTTSRYWSTSTGPSLAAFTKQLFSLLKDRTLAVNVRTRYGN